MPAEKTDKEKAQERIAKWRDRYVRIVNEAKGENLATGKRRKEALAKLAEQVVKAGIPKRSWLAQMTVWDHRDKARALYEKTMAADDADLISGFADLVLNSELSSLPLFAAADLRDMEAQVTAKEKGQDESERVAKARAEDETQDSDGDEKVVPLRETA